MLRRDFKRATGLGLPAGIAGNGALGVRDQAVQPLAATRPAGARHLQRRADGHEPQVQPQPRVGITDSGKRPVGGKQPVRQRIGGRLLTQAGPRRLGVGHLSTVPNPAANLNTESEVPCGGRRKQGAWQGRLTRDSGLDGMVHTWEAAAVQRPVSLAGRVSGEPA